MKYVVADPQQDQLTCWLFESGRRKALHSDRFEMDTTQGPLEYFFRRLSQQTQIQVQQDTPLPVAMRLRYGGDRFTGPTVVGDSELESLRELIPEAPMHLPGAVKLIESIQGRDRFGPVAVTFDTSFFTELPNREQTYGLSPELVDQLNIRRYGFHGLHHEAACEEMLTATSQISADSPLRIISICLEPKPEVCSVMGKRPLTVTGGPTPLEGIPGERSCGEIDPTIVLELSSQNNWGPEKVNEVLTRESGIKGLTEQSSGIDPILTRECGSDTLACQILFYRIQLACGAGIAALGGVDAIVFSGRYASSSNPLQDHLRRNLLPALRNRDDIAFRNVDIPVQRIVADTTFPIFQNQD